MYVFEDTCLEIDQGSCSHPFHARKGLIDRPIEPPIQHPSIPHHQSTDPTHLVPTDEGGQPRQGLLPRAAHPNEEGVPARVGQDAADAGDVLHGLFLVGVVVEGVKGRKRGTNVAWSVYYIYTPPQPPPPPPHVPRRRAPGPSWRSPRCTRPAWRPARP